MFVNNVSELQYFRVWGWYPYLWKVEQERSDGVACGEAVVIRIQRHKQW